MDTRKRAEIHAALGDRHRLVVVDALRLTDLTFSELVELTGLPGNLLAHHLDRLETAGLIERRVSEGDARRRYLTLCPAPLRDLADTTAGIGAGSVLFVCTHNSARSQFAAALWRANGGEAESAGSEPATQVHPKAVRIGREFGVDLAGERPKGYGDVARRHELVVSVCDRAGESGLPRAGRRLHWSVPDPVRAGTIGAFRAAFTELASRVRSLEDAVIGTEREEIQ